MNEAETLQISLLRPPREDENDKRKVGIARMFARSVPLATHFRPERCGESVTFTCSQRWTRNGSQYDRNRVLIYLLLYRYFLSNISQIPGRKICRESNHGWNLSGIVGPRSRWKGWNEGEVSWKKWGAGLVIEMFRRGVRSRVNA